MHKWYGEDAVPPRAKRGRFAYYNYLCNISIFKYFHITRRLAQSQIRLIRGSLSPYGANPIDFAFPFGRRPLVPFVTSLWSVGLRRVSVLSVFD